MLPRWVFVGMITGAVGCGAASEGNLQLASPAQPSQPMAVPALERLLSRAEWARSSCSSSAVHSGTYRSRRRIAWRRRTDSW